MTKTFTAKLIWSVAVMAILGVGGFLFLYYIVPQYYYSQYYMVPLFFLILIFAYASLLLMTKSIKKKLTTRSYYIFKGAKMALSIAFLFLSFYYLIDKVYIRTFALVFFSFYFVTLFLEAWIFIDLSRHE